MSIHANASRHASSLEFVRALVRALSTDKESLSPQLRVYVYDVAHNAALFVQNHRAQNLRPEVIEMAFEIADESSLVDDLARLPSPDALDAVLAKRLLEGFQRFAAA